MSWGKELGTGLFPGEKARRQPGEGRGVRDRGRRAAEAAGAELRSVGKPRCLHGQLWGPGLLSLQCWQKKSQRDRQEPAPGVNLFLSQLLAFLLFLGEFWLRSGRWGGGVLACFAAHVAPSQGWRQWLGR